MFKSKSNTSPKKAVDSITNMANDIIASLKQSPVTLFLIILNLVIFFTTYHYILGYDLANVGQNCVKPSTIVGAFRGGDLVLNRIALSAFVHMDHTHLYYNMISLGWKGIHLEKAQGSQTFLKLVLYSIFTSHLLYVLLGFTLNAAGFQEHVSGFNTCAVGFSATIFSLKYVWNTMSPGQNTEVLGVNIPSKTAAWAELLLINVVSPNTSVQAHVAGILAGYLYLKYATQQPIMK